MRRFTWCCLFLTLTACTTLESNSPSSTLMTTPDSPHHDNLNSVLWVQTAAEYRANTLQTYRSATQNLQAALDDKNWTAALEQGGAFENLPPAVILDVDETVLDNSPYQAQMVLDRTEFESESWDAWIAKKKATAIPGAVEFIRAAQSKGVVVFLVTNRECIEREGNAERCPQDQETLDNLLAIGLSDLDTENTLLKKEKPDWGSEKESRRKFLAQNYRLIMLFGDDLGDFLPRVKSEVTPADREALVKKFGDHWGTKWFMLPNPTYGSWQRVLSEPRSKHLRGI